MTDVYLAVGHGVEPNGVYDPGAIGSDGRQEHLECFQVCNYAWAALRRSGVSTVCEVAQGASHDPDYVGSAARANALGVRIAVEVHFDWKGGVDGFSGLYASSAGAHLASLIGDAFTKRKLPRKTDVHRSDLYFLNATHMPALIPEVRRVHDYPASENEAEGEALAEGICRFLGRTYKAPGPPPPPREPNFEAVYVGSGGVTHKDPLFLNEIEDFFRKVIERNPKGSPPYPAVITYYPDGLP